MFKFKRALSKILFLILILFNLVKISAENLTSQDLDKRIEKVEILGESYLKYLKTVEKDLPEIVKEIDALKDLKIKSNLLNIFLKNYGSVLKLSDLKELSALKDHKDLGDKLILITTYVTLESIMSGLLINLEENLISNNQDNTLEEKINILNNKIKSYITLIKQNINLIKTELDQVLQNNFKIDMSIKTSANTEKKDLSPILKDLNYSEIKNFLKIKKEKLSQKIDLIINQICQKILTLKDLTIIKKITETQAFKKIKASTKQKQIESIVLNNQSLLPKKIQILVIQSQNLLN